MDEKTTAFLREVIRLCQQVRTDIEGIEREILTKDPENPQEFAQWTTVANTFRWTVQIEDGATSLIQGVDAAD